MEVEIGVREGEQESTLLLSNFPNGRARVRAWCVSVRDRQGRDDGAVATVLVVHLKRGKYCGSWPLLAAGRVHATFP